MNPTSVYRMMMMLMVAALLQGCSLDELEAPLIVSEIPQEFSVTLRELPGPEPRNLQLWLQTIDLQDCEEVGIRYDFWPTPGRFRLDISGLAKPAQCLPANKPALEKIDMGVLANGDYQIGINLRNTITNQGRLTRSNASYTLLMETEQGISVPYRQLLRIPSQTIWGYVAYTSPMMVSVASAFISELSGLAPNAALSPGNYGYFWIPSGNGQADIRESPDDMAQRTFVQRFAGNMDDLQALVQAYRTAHGNMLEIKVFAISGEVL